METVRSLLATGASMLKNSNVRKFERDARILLCLALEKDKVFILAHPEFEVSLKAARKYISFIKRRAAGEPIQYITGKQPFWTTEILVGKGCLIPRPETEILVEEALVLAKEMKAPKIADLGCGSGVILKAIAESRGDCRLVGIEKSAAALKWARLNLSMYPNLKLIKGDFFKAMEMEKLDLILSNPPYLSVKEFDSLPIEIKGFEPKEALLAEDPMEPYRAIAKFTEKNLKKGGYLVVEIGSEQAKRHRAFRTLSPCLELCCFRKDLGGMSRVAVLRRKQY